MLRQHELSANSKSELLAALCVRRPVCILRWNLSIRGALPTRLLDSRQISSKRIDPEVIPRELEVSEDSSSLSSLETSIPDLRRACVAVHLRQLKLGLGAGTRGQTEVTNYITESLSVAYDHQPSPR